ncbi:MAG: signal peptidase I, partial [Hungatella hathewayi]|nr:signal peptidase I [Hungatella hathewayi]
MEVAEIQGKSRRQKRKGQRKKGSRETHFQTVGFGGFEESQVICFLWDIVKALEPGADERAGRGSDREPLRTLEKQLRRRIRVEMRRYFVRRRRRNVKLVCGSVAFILCVFCLFGFLIGIDRVSGSSMYPYLNHGDWIVY